MFLVSGIPYKTGAFIRHIAYQVGLECDGFKGAIAQPLQP